MGTILDVEDAIPGGRYTLEVSSRGVGRPLELPRHWRRNVGRLVAVTLTDGDGFTGRIVGTDAETVQVEVDGSVRELDLATVSKAMVQVELNRPKSKIETSEGEEA